MIVKGILSEEKMKNLAKESFSEEISESLCSDTLIEEELEGEDFELNE